ncbi:hypothetical protein BGY98DRAFT_933059 [Russula aff. rugulosa BPL654]|nr:hypothetical protein BGY98DRAFT_933059 [Russula aff. rugulosa BPL654]
MHHTSQSVPPRHFPGTPATSTRWLLHFQHFFSQFGEISRLRLSRNKRTGKLKHYGFIKFVSPPVAQIVAETMDNHLLMGHILTCKVIPKDDVHPELWRISLCRRNTTSLEMRPNDALHRNV